MSDLYVALELHHQTAERLLIVLTLENRSAQRMLVPHSRITDLHVRNRESCVVCPWLVSFTSSEDWLGVELSDRSPRTFDLEVRLDGIDAPRDLTSDYFRYSLQMPAGKYDAWYEFQVDHSYFCPDSHYRFTTLQREASGRKMRLWQGKLATSRIEFEHW